MNPNDDGKSASLDGAEVTRPLGNHGLRRTRSLSVVETRISAADTLTHSRGAYPVEGFDTTTATGTGKLMPGSLSRLLRKRKLTEAQEILLLNEAQFVDPLDFPCLHSAKSQLFALGRMNLDVASFRRMLVDRESASLKPDRVYLKSYLLRYALNFEVIDALMATRFQDARPRTTEQLLFRGDPAQGMLVFVRKLGPIPHGMDIYTIERHASYQHALLKKLFELDTLHIFSRNLSSCKAKSWWKLALNPGVDLDTEVRSQLSPFRDEMPEKVSRIFPEGLVPDRLTFQQKIVLAYAGAERVYALLRPEVTLHNCLLPSEERELASIVGRGEVRGSASFVARYVTLKTIEKLNAFLRDNPAECAVLSMADGYQLSPSDIDRLSFKPLCIGIDWAALRNEAEWMTPNAIRKALANVFDPLHQNRIIESSEAIPLSAYQYIHSGKGRTEALRKLVGDIVELRSLSPSALAEYLMHYTPDTRHRDMIRSMAHRAEGIFRFTCASFEDTSSFRENDSPPWPAGCRRVAA